MRLLRNRLLLSFVLLSAAFLAGGCEHYKGGTYVAKVGNTTLTKADIERVRAQSRDSVLDAHRYIDEWVITELLFQEAERRGIANDEEVRREAEQARRHFAVAALLQREIYDDTTGAGEAAIEAYYQLHKAGFTLREDVVNMSFAAFSDRDAANAFRTQILRGTTWEEAIARYRDDSTGHRTLFQSAYQQYFTRGRTYPPELWKLATTIPRGDVSFVLKVDKAFYVLITHSMMRPGTVPDLGYVRNDVRDRLLIEHRREEYEKLISDLRTRANVDVVPGNIPTE
ncbi:MAG: peptidylprolyl isomerase [Bacteroidota bacterium]